MLNYKKKTLKSDSIIRNNEMKRFPEGSKYILFRKLKKNGSFQILLRTQNKYWKIPDGFKGMPLLVSLSRTASEAVLCLKPDWSSGEISIR